MPDQRRASVSLGEKARIIKKAASIALIGNAALALLKIGSGWAAGSLAVVGDGVDSALDMALALLSLLVAREMTRPADQDHPWGHGRIETIATALMACILFFIGAQIILEAGRNIYARSVLSIPEFPALIATIISIVGKIILAGTQYRLGRQAQSALLQANAKNMAADVFISSLVLVGLIFSFVFKIVVIDSVIALFIGLWIIKAAVGIFMEVNREFMDGNTKTDAYRAVFDAVHSVAGAKNPHRTRMRRIAGFWDIDIDIEVAPELSVQDAHKIASAVEQAIKARIDCVYDIMVHVEPEGRGFHSNEGYGLSEKDIRP
ncbi:MAG: cation diffusion facilitator family transporter [Spirochaetaceae bacterium]|jgi:cation diffusion facilitator family transporter|nr:cation diffusion facilitator family transporter [Spirochaetaceae bacterium]